MGEIEIKNKVGWTGNKLINVLEEHPIPETLQYAAEPGFIFILLLIQRKVNKIKRDDDWKMPGLRSHKLNNPG